MTIRETSRKGGLIITCILLAAATALAVGVARVRVGGPIYTRVEELADFNADILPPPLFLTEAMLTASDAANIGGSLDEDKATLARLEREYRTARDRWAKSELDPALKAELAAGAGALGDRFWTEIDQNLVPALERNDADGAALSQGKARLLYRKHADAVGQLTGHTAKVREALSDHVHLTMRLTLGVMALAGIAVLAMVFVALRLLGRHVLTPLAATAELMTDMAGGDLDRTPDHTDRADEIGDMSRAIAVFRSAGQAAREAAEAQAEVVRVMRGALDRLSGGDLVHRIEQPFAPDYEGLRTAYNTAAVKLDRLVAQVSVSAGDVKVGAAEIRGASDDLSRRNQIQAASIEESGAAVQQAVDLVHDTARRTAEAHGAIGAANSEVANGRRIVDDAVRAMTAIENSSQQIGQIVDLIDAIAFQTNLLALNAGVEAARAGESGRGFAVVATEVRALAQRSAEAAQGIKTLIATSTREVAAGVALVGNTGEALSAIVERTAGVGALVADIARASEQQAVSMDHVNRAVGDIDRLTQQNVAMVEESTAAARSLAEEAEALAEIVSQFRTSGRQPGAMRRAA